MSIKGDGPKTLEMPIAELENPLQGTFKLTSPYLRDVKLDFSTGYWKGKKLENNEKLEIRIVLRSLVEKEINGDASYFKDIFPDNWPPTAPVGITWSYGDWDEMEEMFDYLTTQDFDHISQGNFHEKWRAAKRIGYLSPQLDTQYLKRFSIVF